MADVFEQIDKVDSRALLSSLRENVVRLGRMTAEIERAFMVRELSFYGEMVIAAIEYTGEPLTTVEQKIIDGLAAVWMFNNRPNRSIPALKSRKHTLLSFADSIVQSANESSGYKELKAAGFEHLLFERTVLDHPEFFSQKAQDASRARLGEMNRQALGTLDHMDEDLRRAAAQLERLGFERFSRDGYAFREREIVHLSWVEEADFDNGVTRIWPGEPNRGTLYTSGTGVSTWRQRIEEIDAGQYSTAYVVFGHRAEAAESRKSGDTVALYKMTTLHRIGEEIFADISPAADRDTAGNGQSAQNSPPNHGNNTGKRFTRAPIRPDQFAFRRVLFERFNDRCALTGCTVGQLLDAAHLPGRNWSAGQNSADDGILLRADLHRALDNDLIRLDEQLRLVWVDESVLDLYGHLLSDKGRVHEY
ncbi:HNH endonuclease signature motif containing protein [Paraburkholderia bannensis]|uniref:HNH endonuclease signature motif containing protein n=1 Tax=Paraburkholderia bannensis TaxID=765414 RepID=UPI002AB6174D|nr:HNH endonuclease signature motif containing protein [Paraburkholderia bannensis]